MKKRIQCKKWKIECKKGNMAVGLMFSKPKKIYFELPKPQRVSLHMLFVFYPIDIIFLDEKKKVVEVKRNLKPFRFYTSRKKAKYLIEMPAGKTSTIRTGTIMEFV